MQYLLEFKKHSRRSSHKYFIGISLNERVDLCEPRIREPRLRNYFSKQNLRQRRRESPLRNAPAIRYCANNHAQLFNNRLVSQRFILLARSTELRGDKFERRSGAQQTANNRRIRVTFVSPPRSKGIAIDIPFDATVSNWSATNCRKLRELSRRKT